MCDRKENELSEKLERILQEDKFLDVAEKISLVFLMCDDALKAHRILAKNIFDSVETSQILPDLFSYLANTDRQFYYKFLESLILIKNYQVVRLLGYSKSDINRFIKMFKGREKKYVNSVRKALLRMCESMTLEELTSLIVLIEYDFVKNDSYFSLRNSEQMEMNLLYLIYEDYISDGTINESCNLANLIRHLLKMDKQDLAKELEDVHSANEKNLNKSEYRDEMFPDNDFVEKCGPVFVTPKSIAPSDNDCYSMDKENMGLCIVVNQRNFSKARCSNNGNTPMDSRYGTNCDRDILEITFTGLGYQVLKFQDLTSDELRHYIREVVEKHVLKIHSSVVLCILSHGKRDHIICVDGIGVPFEEIEKMISGDQCPQLLGKPKIVFIQACQGNEFQKACPSTFDDISMPECDGPTKLKVSRRIPPTADLLTFCASVPGYASFRFPSGSVFIQTLCTQLLKHGHSDHLEDVIRMVNDQLSKKHFGKDYYVSMPQVKHTLTKKLYFPYSPQNIFKAAEMLYLKFLVDQLINVCIVETAVKQHYIKGRRRCMMSQSRVSS